MSLRSVKPAGNRWSRFVTTIMVPVHLLPFLPNGRTALPSCGPGLCCLSAIADIGEKTVMSRKTGRGKSVSQKTAARPSAGAGPQFDTFRFNPKLASRLHAATRMIGAPPEWCVQEAMDSFISSIETDSVFRGDMSGNYRIDMENKTRCIVRVVKGGVR